MTGLLVTPVRLDSESLDFLEAVTDSRRPQAQPPKPPEEEDEESQRRKDAYIDLAMQLEKFAEIQDAARLSRQGIFWAVLFIDKPFTQKPTCRPHSPEIFFFLFAQEACLPVENILF